MPKKTPVAVFSYRRPVHLQRALETLSKCPRLAECDIYIFTYPPRLAEHAQLVAQTHKVAQGWAIKLGATVVAREENFGVAHAIVGEVTNLCERYGRVIVIEDDFVLNPDYIRYMLDGLDRYEHEPQVFQISGYMFPVEFPLGQDAYFMPFTTAWGWATWARAWKFFEWQPAGMAELLTDPEASWRFNLNGAVNYTKLLQWELREPKVVYDVTWQFVVFKQQGLVLHPRRSLVWNSGMDGTGSYSSNDPKFPQISREAMAESAFGEKIIWPERVTLDTPAYELLTSVLRERRERKPPLNIRAWHKVNIYLDRFMQTLRNRD